MTRQLGFSLLALFALLAVSTSPAEAALLTGSIGFDANDITANTGDVTTATMFTFSTNAGGLDTQLTTANATGSFAGVPSGTIIDSTKLDLSASPYLTLTLGSDSFTASTLVSSTTPDNNSRVIELEGVIAGPGFTTTPAEFVLSFSQSGGSGNAIAYGGTLSATGVPEPSSMTLMGIGLIVALAVNRRRFGRASRLSA